MQIIHSFYVFINRNPWMFYLLLLTFHYVRVVSTFNYKNFWIQSSYGLRFFQIRLFFAPVFSHKKNLFLNSAKHCASEFDIFIYLLCIKSHLENNYTAELPIRTYFYSVILHPYQKLCTVLISLFNDSHFVISQSKNSWFSISFMKSNLFNWKLRPN